MRHPLPVAIAFVAAVTVAGCGRPSPAPTVRPSILLVTLDTTRADAVGPETQGIVTPAFNAVAARGWRFRQAYATAPETLPSHSSILTGLYPGGHGVHENGRRLSNETPVIAEALQQAGYATAAFVSSFVLARQHGLARGFGAYDDDLAGRVERPARETTDRALAFLAAAPAQPLFLWVHYFDPHAPYEPAEPFRARHAARPYFGEVEAMDAELGRLVAAFERRAASPPAIIIAGDHGEGLGEHGELQHGHLLYQATMRVPLVIAGPGVPSRVTDDPVSIRRVFHTIRDWAGLDASGTLRAMSLQPELVLGEAMKPFLNYGWQPQVMAVEGGRKAILAGRLEVYDVIADPAEARDLAETAPAALPVRQTLRDYPVPSPESSRSPKGMTDDDRRKLASLGYVSASATPILRKDAPRAADMTSLFETLERASALFVAERYVDVIPLLKRVLAADGGNLDAWLRVGTAHSALGQGEAALAAFRKAAALAPRSMDVRLYLALHYARIRDWAGAAPLLEEVMKSDPERVVALEALADIRRREGRAEDALTLWDRVHALRPPTATELVQVGDLAMSLQRTDRALQAFEAARSRQGASFPRDLELGVLYLSARRYPEARDALDRIPASHPEYPMALFKRAQVSVLLNEPDQARRIQLAKDKADKTTKALIANERLFVR